MLQNKTKNDTRIIAKIQETNNFNEFLTPQITFVQIQ